MTINWKRVRRVLRHGLPWELNAAANILDFSLSYLHDAHIAPGPMLVVSAFLGMVGHMIVTWIEDAEREHPIPGTVPAPPPPPPKGTTTS